MSHFSEQGGYLTYSLFQLALVIVGLVFLTDQISPHKEQLPNFNLTMYNFLYIGLWIEVAVTGVQCLLGLGTLMYLSHVVAEWPDPEAITPHHEARVITGSGTRRRKLARQAAKQQSRKAGSRTA